MCKDKWMLAVAVTIGVVMLSAHSAVALDVETVVVHYSVNRIDGVIAGYAADIYIDGTDMTGGKVENTRTGQDWGLALRADGTRGITLMYPDLVSFQAQHLNGDGYHFYINEVATDTYEDQILVGFAATVPTDYAHITNPSHLEAGVELDPVYSWDNIEGLGWAFGAMVRNGGVMYGNTFPDFDLTQTTWQPGPLAPGTAYELIIGIHNITGRAPLALKTLSGDDCTYYGLNEENNHILFSTQHIPEPLSAMLFGTATLTAIGVRRRRRLR